MRFGKPIRGRSGPSKQQLLHNDLLQWAWKLPQPAAFITHQPQQTAFCFILFFLSLPCLLAPIWEPPLSHLVAIQRLDWQVPSNQCGDFEAVGFWLFRMWINVYIVFLPPLGHHRQIFFRTVNDDWNCSVTDRLGQPLPLSEPPDKFCHCQKIWGRLITLDICSLVLQWHSYVSCLLMLHYSKKVADGLCRAQPVTVAQCGSRTKGWNCSVCIGV